MILQTLEEHGMRPTPPAVIESLRTWADKRERISVYPSATLFEFSDVGLLNEAVARGLPGVRLSERMLLVADEQAIDFRHFSLTVTRDYALPPEKCVAVDSDGVTLSVDVGRSDLLLEIQLQRFAEPVDSLGSNNQHRYRLTPVTLANSAESGLGLRELDEWFVQRSGQPLSAAARLLLSGSQAPPPALAPQLVLRVATPQLAECLLPWRGTRALTPHRLRAGFGTNARCFQTARAERKTGGYRRAFARFRPPPGRVRGHNRPPGRIPLATLELQSNPALHPPRQRHSGSAFPELPLQPAPPP